MPLSNGFPGVSGAATFIDLRRDLEGSLLRNADGTLRAGVFPNHTGALVAARGSMGVDVQDFRCVLNRNGAVFLGHIGVTAVPLEAAPAAGSRIDVVYVNQLIGALADSADGPVFGVLTGASHPTAPVKRTDLPVGALELGTVRIPAGAITTQSENVVVSTTADYTTTAGSPVLFRTVPLMNAAAGLGVGTKATVLGRPDIIYTFRNGKWIADRISGRAITPIVAANGSENVVISLAAGQFSDKNKIRVTATAGTSRLNPGVGPSLTELTEATINVYNGTGVSAGANTVDWEAWQEA